MYKIGLKYIKVLSALLIVAAMASCGKPKDLVFGLVHNVSVKSINTAGITLEGTLPVENPNGYKIKAQNADISILAGDKEIARIRQNLPVTLPGNSKGEYVVNATISLGSSNILSVMSIFNNNADLNINGTISLSSFLIHRDVQIHQTGVQNYLKPIINQLKPF